MAEAMSPKDLYQNSSNVVPLTFLFVHQLTEKLSHTIPSRKIEKVLAPQCCV